MLYIYTQIYRYIYTRIHIYIYTHIYTCLAILMVSENYTKANKYSRVAKRPTSQYKYLYTTHMLSIYR